MSPRGFEEIIIKQGINAAVILLSEALAVVQKALDEIKEQLNEPQASAPKKKGK